MFGSKVCIHDSLKTSKEALTRSDSHGPDTCRVCNMRVFSLRPLKRLIRMSFFSLAGIAMILVFNKENIVPADQQSGGKLHLTVDSQSQTPEPILASKELPSDPSSPRKHNSPVLVAMMAYQRSGSSFLSEIFNQNPDAFHWFEPLDGLYSAMYGTKYGHNVPADIWNNGNQERTLPEHEIQAMTRVLNNILTCNFQDLPTEVLLHHFVERFIDLHTSLIPFWNCTKQNIRQYGKQNLTAFGCSEKCNHRLATVCGKRFGQAMDRQSTCYKHLKPNIGDTVDFSRISLKERRILNSVIMYQKCMASCLEMARGCISNLERVCESATVRVVKNVRWPMKAAQRIVNVLPEIKIIHNIRDPRGVAFSRTNTSSTFHSIYAGGLSKEHDVIREASVLCKNFRTNIKIANDIMTTHRNSVLTVVYEKYAVKPKKTAQLVYNFLGLHVPSQVMSWLDTNTKNGIEITQTRRDSKQTYSKWRRVIKRHQKEAVDSECRDLITAVDVWGIN